MSSCPRKQLRSICTACHQGPANSSFSGRFSPPRQQTLEGGEASVSSFLSTSDTSRQAGQCLITGTTFTTHSRPQAPGGCLPTEGEETHSRCPRPQLLLLTDVQDCWALQTPGGGGWGGQNPAMELFPSSRVLLNAAMGRVGGKRVGVG